MIISTKNENGPASVGALPDRGSINPGKDMKMNEATNTTAEHPWEAARRLSRELSAVLGQIEGADWAANVMPPVPQAFVGFAAFPMGPAPDEYPVDHINRLAWELSSALDTWQGGTYQAMVLPASTGGHTVMFTSIKAWDRRAES